MSKKPTLGIIVGNRGFFPDHLCKAGRAEVLRVLEGGKRNGNKTETCSEVA